MFSSGSLTLLTSLLCALISSTAAAPFSAVAQRQAQSNFWMANINARGTVWSGGQNNTTPDTYQVFRNVMDEAYGATGNGKTDDTAAIQKAIDAQQRCTFALGCNSSTILPAIIYFPPGTYLISSPIKMAYMTQMVGDATDKPVLQASPAFSGMAMLDADPYEPTGANWWVNQNNFFRQVRNFVIDLTGSTDTATGIHWQVAQATSLQNLDFKMNPNSQQQGIFMDNGSGGFMSDLTFEGGKIGAFLGSQQFTSRNMQFNNVKTAIFMNWNWGWTLSNITVTNSDVALDMSNSPANQTVGSVVLSDSIITNTTVGVMSAYGGNGTGSNLPATGGTLVLDNVQFTSIAKASVYQNATQEVMIPGGNQKVTSWSTGSVYQGPSQTTSTGRSHGNAPSKAAALLADGNIFGRSKPQYEDLSANDFILAKKDGRCAGDGHTDDTQCVQKFLNTASQQNKVAYFDHGAYLIKDTVLVPDKVKVTGEVWPLIMADSASFDNAASPKPVFKVGTGQTSGATGQVEISDIIFQTNGPAPGAVMIEWNLNSAQGGSGMWDTHIRIGGSAGTNLQTQECYGDPSVKADTTKCKGVFMMFHATKSSGGIYLENDWFWVADHDLDVANQTQISLYSARGALFESQQGAVWLWGTASEHSIIYNYQIKGVKAFFGGFMQTETPYFQPQPLVPSPVTFNRQYDDPTFSICPADEEASADPKDVPCKDAWGMRIWNSKALIYSTGMYSFFNNYMQECTPDQSCQEYMIRIQNSDVDMYAVTTKAALKMIADDRYPGKAVMGADNRNVFGDTLAYYKNY